jgi:NitT/TauT family transport system ATP-binding protein
MFPQQSPASVTSDHFIVARNVTHTFLSSDRRSRFVVLDNLSFPLERGRFYSLLGPSGCGKTTLLRILGGLVRPTRGAVQIDGQVVRDPPPQVSVVFQDFRLLPWRSVTSNIEFPLELQGVAKSKRQLRSAPLIELIGLQKFRQFFPHQLSGGMRQRVSLARALITDPEILLMDEPFAALDAQMREVLQIELLKLWEASNLTVVFVTHSVDEAVLLSDEILVMGRNPGRIKEWISVDLPRPRWRDEVRNSLEFVELRSRVWDLLRPEVAAVE